MSGAVSHCPRGVGIESTVVSLAGDPLLGVISQGAMPLGENRFDAMMVKVEHRFSKGFSVLNPFTWSKLFEDTSLLGPEITGVHVEHKLGGEVLANVW